MNRHGLRRFAAAVALVTMAGAPAAAAGAPLWLRYPAISPDGATVVFTYRGDLYRVPAMGGVATPLTTHAAHDFMPVWSPDGRQLAFASDRRGNFDVYVMPASGGEARRLTFHSADEQPYAFTPDGSAVLFGAARQDPAQSRLFPTGSMPELYRVPVAGGRPELVLATPAEDVQPSRDGRLLLYHDKKGGENAWRKHHTSAIARDVWVHDASTGQHRKLTTFAGEDRNPVFAPDEQSVHYLSEESGSFNVRRMPLAGGASQPVTSFTGGPVRFLTRAADGTLCFGHDGEIYTLAPGGSPRKLAVTIAQDAAADAEKVVAVNGGARELAVAPSGKEVAFVARGDVFVTSVEGGVTRRITDTPGEERSVSFSPDGKALLYASQRGGSWKLFEARRRRDADPYFYVATVLDEKALVANEHDNTQPAWSPDGKQVAYVEDRATLRVLDLGSGQTRTLLTARELAPGGQNFQWSPDGRHILFDLSVPGFAPGEIGLVAADGSSPAVNLTRSGFSDGDGQWVLGGTAMIWRSNRDGLKAVAQTGRTQQDAYGLFFTRAAWDRFRLTKEEYALVKEAEEKKEKEKKEAADKDKDAKDKKGDRADKKDAKPEPVAFDMDGLAERKARLTLHSSILGDVLLSKDGETLYYLAQFEKGFNLWSTSLRGKETKQVLALDANNARMAWDAEQKTIFLLADGGLSKVDPATAKKEGIAIKGEAVVDVAAARAAQFEHVWRQTAKTFYTAGFHGADWNALKATYARFVPHVGNDFEMAELLSEMLGELNVSHSGARHSASEPGDDATASLGLLFDPAHRGPGLKIDEVLAGGPLDKATVTVRPGMVLESIDGVPLAADADLARLLNRRAGKTTLVGLADGARKLEAVVRPIDGREEDRLLYRRWVRRNQEEVERLSGGALGYVHVPGMNDGAYRSVFEEVMGRYADRKGLVVDVRFNGGGDLVADLAMFLSGRRFFDYTTDTRSLGFEPNFRWTKPSVSIVNEAAYSDGHCYAYTIKALGIGKLVGRPVPGTCTFAGWELLGDSGIRWGAPPTGVKGLEGRYLENAETTPDLDVALSPELVLQGRDEQLEAAVAALMKELAGPSR
ncbi:MAG: PD40 domain-containing protein [Vicinamibacteria bacterium]|nr:PD40 domain-containing protein [Vicinamibacteria bacterium]